MMRHLYLMVLLAVIAAECFYFVGLYVGIHPIRHFRLMWPEGKHLTLFSACFGALAAWLVAGDFLALRVPWVTPALVTVIAVLLGQRVRLLKKARRERRLAKTTNGERP